MSSLWRVHRPHASSYLERDFRLREQARLERIPGVGLVSHMGDRPNILLTDTHFQVEDDLRGVELIVHANSGYDNFSAEFVQNFPGVIVAGQAIRAQAVAQYVLACLFDRYVRPPFDSKAGRTWQRKRLQELEILLIGAGHVGEILRQTLAALGVDCQVCDPYKGRAGFDLQSVQVVILCCGQNRHNTPLIGAAFLQNASPVLTIVNAARAGLIASGDLADFLKSHPRACAYLDVASERDLFEGLANVRQSSHVAGIFAGIEEAMIDFEYAVIRDYTTGMPDFERTWKEGILANKISQGVLI